MEPRKILILSESETQIQELVELLPDSYEVQCHLYEQGSVPQGSYALVIIILPEQNLRQKLSELGESLKHQPVVIVTPTQPSLSLINAMLDLHPLRVLKYPLRAQSARRVLDEALHKSHALAKWYGSQQKLAETNQRLNRRLQELNALYTIAQDVTSTLDLDEVLRRIVESSVNLTETEEGFILLREGNTLYLRASKNMDSSVVQRLNTAVMDSIAWQVVRSGRPTMLQRESRIATGYLVRSLLYIPLQTPGHGTIGVLGVFNRTKVGKFTENHLFTLTSIAGFAATALENARLFDTVEKERSRLNALLKHASEAILVVDEEDHLRLWSETAARLFSIPADAKGKSVETCLQNSSLVDLFHQAVEQDRRLHAEIELADGQVFNAQLTPIRNVGRVVIMQDITHLKELDRLKSEFVSTVSHDLRTPLTTIQGYIALLDRVGSLNDMQRDFIRKSLNSLTHITEMISDLLDIGRIEAGYNLEMVPCRMDEIIGKAVALYADAAEQQQLRLEVDLPDAPLWVHGTPRRLQQVVENLLSNAIKYNRPHGKIYVRAMADEHHVIVKVEDTGIGIPLEEQPRVFERFYRVQSDDTQDIAGTGLGLAIVKSVIEKHKGRVWVESTPGEGSTFAFVLPLYTPAEV